MKKKLIWIGISILGVIILILTLGKLNLRRKLVRYAPPPTKKEAEQIQKQTEALVERAKAEATGEEKQKQIDEILKEEDPRVRLERLAKAIQELR